MGLLKKLAKAAIKIAESEIAKVEADNEKSIRQERYTFRSTEHNRDEESAPEQRTLDEVPTHVDEKPSIEEMIRYIEIQSAAHHFNQGQEYGFRPPLEVYRRTSNGCGVNELYFADKAHLRAWMSPLSEDPVATGAKAMEKQLNEMASDVFVPPADSYHLVQLGPLLCLHCTFSSFETMVRETYDSIKEYVQGEEEGEEEDEDEEDHADEMDHARRMRQMEFDNQLHMMQMNGMHQREALRQRTYEITNAIQFGVPYSTYSTFPY